MGGWGVGRVGGFWFGVSVRTLLRFHLHRTGHRTGAHRSECLHAHRVNGVWRQLGDGRQLAVVDHLRVPRRLRLIGSGREVHFVALQIYVACLFERFCLLSCHLFVLSEIYGTYRRRNSPTNSATLVCLCVCVACLRSLVRWAFLVVPMLSPSSTS